MFKPLNSFALFSLLTLSSAASAHTFITPKATVQVTTTDISGQVRGSRSTFSLRAALRRDYGPACTATFLVRPLSLVGDLLSVELQASPPPGPSQGPASEGAGCGPAGRVVQVYRIGGKQEPPALSTLVGETALLNALRADPYLKRHWSLPGSATLEVLEQVMTRQPFYNAAECRLGPAPLGTANLNFAFWQSDGRSLNVRLALPFLCDVAPSQSDFLWLGLIVPLPPALRGDVQPARRGQGFLGAGRPVQTVRIRLK